MGEADAYAVDDLIKFKLIVVGDQATGKSCILNRFVNDTFDEHYQATIGLDFQSKNVKINDQDVRLILYDTAGQEKFRSLIPMYIREAQIILMIYDITRKESFESMPKWFDDVSDVKTTDAVYALIGNKTDLESERKVSKEEGQKFAEEKNMIFAEVSAKSGDGFEDLFNEQLYSVVYKKFKLEFDRREILEGDDEQDEEEDQEQSNQEEQQQQPQQDKRVKLDAKKVTDNKQSEQKKKKKCC